MARRSPWTSTILLLALSRLTTSSPLPANAVLENHPAFADAALDKRQGCANPCGWQGQLCCASNQVCFIDSNNQAQCGTASGNQVGQGVQGGSDSGYWQTYTSTWVETGLVTMTSVYSSWVAPQATPAGGRTCQYHLNESPCGDTCCPSGQYCFDPASNKCAAAGGAGHTTVGIPPDAAPPSRPTTGTQIIVTATVSPTTTVPFVPPVATGVNVDDGEDLNDTSSGGLSGGAIAGIVIGVLAAIFILITICLCCVAKGLLSGLLAILGIGKKKESRHHRRSEYIEEHRHHHGSSGASSRHWYGDRPSRPEKKKTGGLGGAAGVAAGLAGLAIALGLKRKHDKKHAKSEYTESDYTYDSMSSPSSLSSDERRTRYSRSSRPTRSSRPPRSSRHY